MERYYVKRPTGKVFGPFDENAIRLMVNGNKLGADAQVSTDNETWLPISQVDAFANSMGSRARGGVGIQDLPRTAGPADLPRSAGGPPDLPTPRAMPDLPVSRGASDLPRSAGGASDLPRSAGGASDLPRSAGGARDLPRSASNLPGSAAELPQSAQNLPRSASNLPSPAASKASLFDMPVGLAEPSDDDLFAAPAGLREESDDLFAAPAGMEEDSDDLFAAPAGMEEDSDDLFAAPAGLREESEDLFGPPPSQAPALAPSLRDDDEDDLFGPPPEQKMDDDDLFASAPAGDDDDFLGGDAGFSFLEDEPKNISFDAGGGLEDWEEDIQTNDSFSADDLVADDWGEELDEDDLEPMPSQKRAAGSSRTRQPASTGAAGDPLRPASTGIRQPEPSPTDAATADVDAAVDADKKRGLVTMIGVPALALILLGGGGFALYNAFFTGDEVQQQRVERGPTAVSLDLDEILRDNYQDLLRQIDRANEGDLDTENRGLLLLAQNLFLLRYEDGPMADAADALAVQLTSHEDVATVAAGLAMAEARNAQPDSARAFAEAITTDPEHQYLAHLAMGIADLRAHIAGQELEEPTPAPAPAVEDEERVDEEDGAAEGLEEAPQEPADEVEVVEEATPRMVQRGLTHLERAVELNPTAPHPHYWIAQLHISQGEVDLAVAALQQAIDANPDHLASRLVAAQVHYDRGSLNDANEDLSHIINDLTEAGSEAERGAAFHLMGMVNMARQENTEAIEMFTRALSADSSREDTLRQLARTYERAGLYEEALNFFTTNQNLGEEDPEVMLGIARSHMGMENDGSAIRQLEAGEELFPEDARFPYYLGRLNLQRGTLYEARRAFENAVELDPDLLDARADLATLYWRLEGDATQALQQIREIVQRPERLEAPIAAQVADFYRQTGQLELAREWNQEALRIDPNYWEARLALSRLLLDESRTAEALTLLERARNEGIQDLRLAAYLAEAYRQNSQFDRAIDEINSVIAQRSDDREFIFTRGRIYYDQGNYATAREDFNYAYQLDPRFHTAYFWVGRTSLAEEDYTTAARIFRHVLDYQPDNGNFHYYMGRTFEADGSNGQALESYRRATAVDREFAARTPEIFVRRGRLLTRMGFTGQGKRDIQVALDMNPNMVNALLAMGETNMEEQDYDNAIQHLSRALQRDPEHPSAQRQLGMAYVYLNQNQNGARHLRLALHHGYDRPDIYRVLGFLYREMNQRQQAIEAFRNYLVESGDALTEEDQRAILRQIQELGG